MNCRCLLSLVVLCCFVATAAFGQEWTRFRGPNGTGAVPAIKAPLPWTEKDYRWRIELPGKGHSSPVVWGKKLFVTACEESTATVTVCAIDTADGHTLWKYELAGKPYKKSPLNTYAASTPAVDAQRVYVAWGTAEHCRVVALEQASGKEVWQFDLGPFEGEHGFGSSPMLVDDMMVIADEQDGTSFIIALGAADGKVRWRTPRNTEKAAYSTPCVFRPKQGPAQLIVTSWAHGIGALEIASGKQLWEMKLFTYRVVGSPLVTDELVVATCGGGGKGRQLFAVRPGTQANGMKPEKVYEIKPPMPYVPAPIADSKRLYLWGDEGIITCLNLADGQQVWQERLGGKYFTSPILIGDRLLGIDNKGLVSILAASEKYQVLGKVDLGEATHATPAVGDGTLYLRTLSHLMALGAK
jgi:outer membrane protein assembly factor BamB